MLVKRNIRVLGLALYSGNVLSNSLQSGMNSPTVSCIRKSVLCVSADTQVGMCVTSGLVCTQDSGAPTLQ